VTAQVVCKAIGSISTLTPARPETRPLAANELDTQASRLQSDLADAETRQRQREELEEQKREELKREEELRRAEREREPPRRWELEWGATPQEGPSERFDRSI